MSILYLIGIFYLCPLVLCLLLVKLIHGWAGYSPECLRKAVYFSITPAANIAALVIFIITLYMVLGVYVTMLTVPWIDWIENKVAMVVDKIVVIMEGK